MIADKKLAINLDLEFTVNLFYGLPLAILTTKAESKNWINQNYMLPVFCLKQNDFAYFVLDAARYGALNTIPSSLIMQTAIGKHILKNVKNMVAVIKERIDNHWYSIVFLDNFYLSFSAFYEKEHFVHEVLIYGYNDAEKSFSAVVYGKKMMKTRISYDSFKKALDTAFCYIDGRGDWREYMLMHFKSVESIDCYPYDIDRFIEKLKSYYMSEFNEQAYFEFLNHGRSKENTFKREDCYFGMSINKAVVNIIENIRRGYAYDLSLRGKMFNDYYSIFHVYAEFHLGLYKKMISFSEKIKSQSVENGYILSKYYEIVKNCEKIRILYLKLVMVLKGENYTSSIQTIDRMLELAYSILKNERETIECFLQINDERRYR